MLLNSEVERQASRSIMRGVPSRAGPQIYDDIDAQLIATTADTDRGKRKKFRKKTVLKGFLEKGKNQIARLL